MTGSHAVPSKQYSVAYEMHYTDHDLHAALDQYVDLIDMHPDSVEAEYSRIQIQNIVKTVVPADELLSSLVQLLRRRFESMDN